VYNRRFPLAIGLLQVARRGFVGRHDFAALQAAGGVPFDDRANDSRTSGWTVTKTAGEIENPWADFGGQKWVFTRCKGDGFLLQHGRNLSHDDRSRDGDSDRLDWIDEAWPRTTKNLAGETAPAQVCF